MKIQTVNNITFGNAQGGIKYLKIIKEDKSGTKFIEVPQEISDVGVFVAGGKDVDKKVLRARLKVSQTFENKQIIAKPKSRFMQLFEKLVRF